MMNEGQSASRRSGEPYPPPLTSEARTTKCAINVRIKCAIVGLTGGYDERKAIGREERRALPAAADSEARTTKCAIKWAIKSV